MELETLCRLIPNDDFRGPAEKFLQTFALDPSLLNELRQNMYESGRGPLGTGHGFALIHLFSQCGNELAVQLLVEYGVDVNATNKHGFTALHYAIGKDHDNLVRMLSENGALVNDYHVYKAFELAVVGNHSDYIEVFVENNANVNAKNHFGNTLLMQIQYPPRERPTVIIDGQ